MKVAEKSFSASVLVSAIAVAAALRIIGIKFGLPQAFHPDEPILVLATQRFFQGDFNPHNFYYPSLLMYMMHAVQRFYYAFTTSPIELAELYVLSRLTVALIGIASLFVVYKLGKEIFNKSVGLVSALFLAVSPLHVINSHYATTDVPLAFFILLTILFTVFLYRQGNWKHYLLTGLFLGLTVSTKIPGGIIFVSILLAHFIRVKNEYALEYWTLIKQSVSIKKLVWFGLTSLLICISVLLVFYNFHIIADFVIDTFEPSLWINNYDRILTFAPSMGNKLALLSAVGVFAVLLTFPVWKIESKKIAALIGIAVAAFFLTTPYAILDYKQFFSDFFHQAVVSNTTWGGMFHDASPPIVYYFNLLVKDIGLINIVFLLFGLFFIFKQRQIEHWVFFSFMLMYLLYMNTWSIMFERYLVPLIPFALLTSAWGIYNIILWLLDKLPLKHPKNAFIVLICMIAVSALPFTKMLKDSITFDKYLLKKHTRTIGYEWGLENIGLDKKILIENYAPQLSIANYDVHNVYEKFDDIVTEQFVRENGIDYIFVTSKMWERKRKEDGVVSERLGYSRIQEYAELVHTIQPNADNPGPIIKIYKVKTQ